MVRTAAGIAAVVTFAFCINGVATASPVVPTSISSSSCDPVTTKPHFRGDVPTPKKVLGFDLGTRAATDDEITKYWGAVDKASPRVETGIYAHSWEKRPLNYALVGSPQNLKRLPEIRQNLAKLRDPSTPQKQAEAIMRNTPTILWIAANVHGNEPAGGDAVLQLLYELSDRDDCVANAILKNAIVGLIPTQNPDGREHDVRTNGYAFDMNRDWFAGTQPETAGKLALLWKYPPQVFVDEHEMGGSNYFFPPDADPIYSETSDSIYHEIAKRYGAANEDAFTREGWQYETYQAGYDLFYQGYGDSVPTTEFGAAGMTFEQGENDSYQNRTEHHYMAALVTLYTGATNRQDVLSRWRQSFVEAQDEGANCQLERNKTYNPGHQVERQVPKRPVCGYFLLGHSADTQLVVHRLQSAHVEVDKLAKKTVIADYKPYGSKPRQTTLPAGTYWITLDQPQKHWVQAMLNENTYVPFPYFYDVSGWSNPLLSGIPGGSTGQPLQAKVEKVAPVPAPGPPAMPKKLPRVAILDQFGQTINDYQTTGWLKWRLDHDWDVPYTVLQPNQVSDASLSKIDVLLVPNVDADPVYGDLGTAGRKAVVDWVHNGGRYVGWEEGASLASALGISSVGLSNPQASSPGALMRITTPQGPNEIMWSDDYDVQMSPGDARVVASFTPHMFVSGYAKSADTLAGTPVEAVDDVGKGSTTVFTFEPNFRAFTDGSARLLMAAMLGTPQGSVPSSSWSTSDPVYSGVGALKLAPTPEQRRAIDNQEGR